MSSTRHGKQSLVDQALAYARHGWSILPTRGKKPVVRWKEFQAAPAKDLARLFDREDVDGLAVITGRASGGLAVRDWDRPAGYHTWANTHPDEAALLPTVQTFRGFHVYGRLTEETYATLADGELRADAHHYTLLPPSRHPEGSLYRWLLPLPPAEVSLPLLPSSLVLSCANTQDTHANPCLVSSSFSGTVNELIERTLPMSAGQRNRKIFDLARGLVGLLGRTADRGRLRMIVQEWHRHALPVIRTKAFDETWTDFARAWEGVKLPAGHTLTSAAAAADAAPLPAAAGLYEDPRRRRLVAICAQLQKLWGEKPFPLGCRQAGELLGVSRTEANCYLRVLAFDQVIRMTRKGTKTSGKASEWLYVGGPA